MTKTRRNLAVAVMMAAWTGIPQASMAADVPVTAPAPMSHVRTLDLRVAGVVQSAYDRSATFRKLVAIIDASDSYVYIHVGTCGHGVRACFVSVTASDTNRFMWVVVDGMTGDTELTGHIAHELQHTIEVIKEPAIRSSEAKYFFYERTATHASDGTHETLAAMKAEKAVRSELKNASLLRTSHGVR